jgi:hypothetical protein
MQARIGSSKLKCYGRNDPLRAKLSFVVQDVRWKDSGTNKVKLVSNLCDAVANCRFSSAAGAPEPKDIFS